MRNRIAGFYCELALKIIFSIVIFISEGWIVHFYLYGFEYNSKMYETVIFVQSTCIHDSWRIDSTQPYHRIYFFLHNHNIFRSVYLFAVKTRRTNTNSNTLASSKYIGNIIYRALWQRYHRHRPQSHKNRRQITMAQLKTMSMGSIRNRTMATTRPVHCWCSTGKKSWWHRVANHPIQPYCWLNVNWSTALAIDSMWLAAIIQASLSIRILMSKNHRSPIHIWCWNSGYFWLAEIPANIRKSRGHCVSGSGHGWLTVINRRILHKIFSANWSVPKSFHEVCIVCFVLIDQTEPDNIHHPFLQITLASLRRSWSSCRKAIMKYKQLKSNYVSWNRYRLLQLDHVSWK